MEHQEGEESRGGHSPKWHRVALAVMAIAMLLRLLCGQAYRGSVGSPRKDFSDFIQYHDAANRVRAGEAIYTLEGYPYSPLVALAVRPLAGLPLDRAFRVWTAINVAMLVAAVALFGLALRLNPLAHFATWVVLLLTAFEFWPSIMEFFIGNVDMTLLALLAGIFVAESRGRPMGSAVLIALAALVKTWFLGLVLYLLLRRTWRPAVAAVLCYAVGFAGLFTIVGWWQFPGFVAKTRQWSSQPGGLMQCIPGVATMYFSDNPHIRPLTNLPHLATAISLVGRAALGGGLIALAWGQTRPDERRRMELLSLVMLTLLLAMPVSQGAYYVFALPAIWLMLVFPHSLATVAVGALGYLILRTPSPAGAAAVAPYREFPASLKVVLPFIGGGVLWVGLLVTSLARKNDLRNRNPTEMRG